MSYSQDSCNPANCILTQIPLVCFLLRLQKEKKWRIPIFFFSEGNILIAMAGAVEKAEAVLMCVSRAYKASANCQTGIYDVTPS